MNTEPAVEAKTGILDYSGDHISRAAYWGFPPLVCLILYWPGFTAWFHKDDFAWLSLGLGVHSFHDLLAALVTPFAQGTIRPWSERVFFMAGHALFGMNSLPYRLVIFGTMFVNLGLVESIGARITGSRAAGFWAALFWVANSALALPLGWACVYNQVLCAFFLLLAFHFLLKFIETGERRFEFREWIVFLAGFGALELNIIYPALAAVYTFLCAPKYFRRSLWLFLPSIVYFAIHQAVAPAPRTGIYGLYFDGAISRTVLKYWGWSLGPTFAFSSMRPPHFLLTIGLLMLTAGSAVFLIVTARARGAFFLFWWLIAIAPFVPLRNHVTQYYIFIPVIGLCWLGGWAFATAWRSGGLYRFAGLALAAVYVFTTTPEAVATSQWNHRLTMRSRTLMDGVAQTASLHPGSAIILEGVDADLFLSTVHHRPFRLLGLERVYLSEENAHILSARPDVGDIPDYVVPAGIPQAERVGFKAALDH